MARIFQFKFGVLLFSMLLIASNLDTKVMVCKDDLWSLFIKTRNLVHFTNISVSIPSYQLELELE